MPHFLVLAALALSLALPGRAQLKLDLDHLAKRAKESVEITLDGTLLNLAGRFLSADKPDEAKAKALISGLKSIYVRSFEFDKSGTWSPADLEAVRNQLRAPGWARAARLSESSGKETTELYLRVDGNKTTGIAVITAEPHAFTIVHILGDIDVDKLGDLSGQFGIPKLPKALR